jgi:mannose-1-phosphate guanylyltransferase/mannose-6-phosphate isomerase
MQSNTTGMIVPVIMAGGVGTRLWPISREKMPKQFIALMQEGCRPFKQP